MVTTIKLFSGTSQLPVDVYDPLGKSKGLIVIIYGSDGLTDHLNGPWKTMIHGYASSLADQGFCAVIPDYLSTTNTPPGPVVFDVMFRLRDAWHTALSDAIDHVVMRNKIDPKQVGMLGFSLGGYLALRLRTKAKILVEFFSPVLDGIGAPSRTLMQAQIHHGQSDEMPGTEFSNALTIERTLKQEGVATELYPYPGAGHGFTGSDKANQLARDLSKARTLSFFQAHL